MTVKKLPIYVPVVDSFSFDTERIIKEIDTFIGDKAQERTLPFKNGKSIYDPEGKLSIADDDMLNDASRYYLNEEGQRVPVAGKLKTYHVYNLTYLPEEPESLIDIYRSDDPDKRIFWHTYKKPFTWREELENSYIKQAVEQFPWEYIQGVRLIRMFPPSVGQIHKDSHPKANYRFFREGHVSLSFNIADGGGILNYLDENSEQRNVDNNIKIFHFDDSVAHGVTPISSPRYQLRMWGKLKVPYETILKV